MPSKLSKGFVESVKSNPINNIVSVLKEYVSLNPFGENKHHIICINPEHVDDNPSMVVNELWNNAFCFGCKKSYDTIGVIQHFRGLNFFEALRFLCERASIPFDQSGISPEDLAREELKNKLRKIVGASIEYYHQKLFEPESEPIRKFLKEERGLTKETVKTFKLGWGGIDPEQFVRYIGSRFNLEDVIASDILTKTEKNPYFHKMTRRIVIPLFDEFGHSVGVAGRTIGGEDTGQKYWNLRNTLLYEKKNYVYGLDLAKKEIIKNKEVVLTEGYFDVIKAYQNGFKNVIACGSSSYAVEIFKRLRKMTDKLISCMDADGGGRVGIKSIFKNSSRMGFIFRIAMLPDGMDIDDFLTVKTPFQFKAILQESVGVTKYRLNRVLGSKKFFNEEEMARAYRGCVQVLSEEPERPIRQKHYEEIAKVFKLNEEEIKEDVENSLKLFKKPERFGKKVIPGYFKGEKDILSAIMHGKAEFVKSKISLEQFVSEKIAKAAKIGCGLVCDNNSKLSDCFNIEEEEIKSLILEAAYGEFSLSEEKLIEIIAVVVRESKNKRFEELSSMFKARNDAGIKMDYESKEFKEYNELMSEARKLEKNCDDLRGDKNGN